MLEYNCFFLSVGLVTHYTHAWIHAYIIHVSTAIYFMSRHYFPAR